MGHYYASDGTPVHRQPKKGGGTRDTTLADAKKQGLFESVKTQLGIIDPLHGSTGNVIEAAYNEPPKKGESIEDYAQRIRQAAFQEDHPGRADLGTQIHDAISKAFLGEPYEWPMDGYVQTAHRVIAELGLSVIESEKVIVSAQYGYAGTMDVAAGKGMCCAILDWKTKITQPGQKVRPNRTDCAQVAAYWMAYYGGEMREPNGLAMGYNVYLSINEEGRFQIQEWTPQDLRAGWQLFKHVLACRRLLSGHDPRQPKPANTHE